MPLHSKVRRRLFKKKEKKMFVVECPVNDVTLVATMTNTSAQGEAYWRGPSFLYGSFVAHAFVNVKSCYVVCCCCCCWAYLLIIVVSFGTIFCIVFLFRTVLLTSTPFSS